MGGREVGGETADRQHARKLPGPKRSGGARRVPSGRTVLSGGGFGGGRRSRTNSRLESADARGLTRGGAASGEHPGPGALVAWATSPRHLTVFFVLWSSRRRSSSAALARDWPLEL
jgi:hypothetical protein